MVMQPFIHDDFMLDTKQARELYHNHASCMPIIDYHCHLSPAEVAEDRRWENIAQMWLHGDHYKWRAMRSNGVAERYCTGEASDREKYDKWAETVPHLLRNPLYHWTHLEMARYFNIEDRQLGPATADYVWDRCNEQIKDPGFSCRSLMKNSNVVLVCTTDDPVDSLEHHMAVAADESFDVIILPTWRPDKGMAIEDQNEFNAWVDKLAAAADVDITGFTQYMEAFRKRHDFFHEVGCRLSDHGLETIYAEDYSADEVAAIFDKARSGKQPSEEEVLKFKSAMLYEFGVMDHEKGWTQQYHLGALRNNNSRMFELLGPDTGFDSIGDFEVARPMSRLLDSLAVRQSLARTILYCLNPRDNALLVTMLGNFQDGSVPGKMQFGSSWWFLDQKDGIERQLLDLEHMGLLSRFVGMLTDSRSFLSYTRHEYFRRVLCNLLARQMSDGMLPDDMTLVGSMVENICYNNAASYFGFSAIEPITLS